jgi:hypothetical protein
MELPKLVVLHSSTCHERRSTAFNDDWVYEFESSDARTLDGALLGQVDTYHEAETFVPPGFTFTPGPPLNPARDAERFGNSRRLASVHRQPASSTPPGFDAIVDSRRIVLIKLSLLCTEEFQ